MSGLERCVVGRVPESYYTTLTWPLLLLHSVGRTSHISDLITKYWGLPTGSNIEYCWLGQGEITDFVDYWY